MGIVAELKHGAEEFWDSAAEGWRRLSQQTAGALTRFKPGRKSSAAAGDDAQGLSIAGWALLAGDVFEDDKRLVVRIEVPGMEKSDFDIEMQDDMLIVRGEKHLESESGEGRYRVLQCAYGSFSRTIRLPARIDFDQAKASYDKGVLKIELPKAKPGEKENRVTVA
jgi:HSP20 family protein